MTAWDFPLYLDLAVVSLDDWDGAIRPFSQTSRSQFSAPISSTHRALRTELDALDALDRTLYVPVAANQFRRDGRPRSDAKLTGSALILTFDVDGQTHQYAADRFITWQENLRAIALTLEALRAVARYGLTEQRQQYTGFLAIEPAHTAHAFTAATAEEFVQTIARRSPGRGLVDLASVVRLAKRLTHPDQGGDPDEFQQVTNAETVLREAGRL